MRTGSIISRPRLTHCRYRSLPRHRFQIARERFEKSSINVIKFLLERINKRDILTGYIMCRWLNESNTFFERSIFLS